MRLVCFGDSITRACDFPESDRWPLRLRDHLLSLGLPVKVYNRGVGGHTSAQGVDRFGEDVLPLLPAWVLVQFGFNDCNVRDWALEPRVGLAEYQRNLRHIHRLVLRGEGRPVFIVNHEPWQVTGAQGNGLPYEQNHAPYAAALRALIQELGADVIDLPALTREAGLEAAALLGPDGLHLSALGNRHYADLVLAGLLPLLDAAGLIEAAHTASVA
jgi:lysophospholipase L1-like esterase